MAAIRLHPVTKKPSVYWYEPSGKKRQKTFNSVEDGIKTLKIALSIKESSKIKKVKNV